MLIAISFMLYGTAFILGFIVGRFNINHSNQQMVLTNSTLKRSNSPSLKKQIKIDEQKFVTSVKTDSLESKGKSLGSKMTVDDDLNSEVLKLSQLKKK